MDKHFLHKIGVFFALLTLFFFLISTTAFSNIQVVMTDKLHGSGKALDNIIIIEIDDESINKIGRWPWERDVFAEIFLKLKGAKIIGADLSFFETSNNDLFLNTTLQEIDNIVLAAEISGDTLYKPIFDNDFGYVNLISDSDGVVRSLRIDARDDAGPFSLAIYKKAWGESNSKESIKTINFQTPPGGFQSIKVIDLLNNSFDFKNKYVFVGATATDLHDVHMVPTSEGVSMSGVEIQAHIFQNFVLGNFIKKQNIFFTLFLVSLISFVGFFIFSKLKMHFTIPLILLTIISYALIGILLFKRFDYITDFFFFPLALIVFTGTGIGMNYLEEKKNNAYITEAFGKYVDKDLLKEIIEKKNQLNLGGEKREITIFFSDIRGFTTISEKLAPEELGFLINTYLTKMTEVILEYHGTIDKFIGDAVMAFWNAPLLEKDHALLACKSSIAQIRALEELNKELKKKDSHPIKIGCGINTGEAVVGNFGSKDRFDYTAFGDTINAASRLEGLTKFYGIDIAISETTYALVKDSMACRKLDAVKLKGKKKPLLIYELCLDENKEFINQYEKALELYFKSKFKQALSEFKKARNIKEQDISCGLFIERCKEYIKNPPEKDWDGAFEMKTK
ncbi:MAG: adenylate/guanylate cyclase domain-containing protein [Nanoarchaeota archaeon]|nr:adenylate/guanylate cyclase domain-containing protein [Nanoarchaeota archaeon]